MDRCCPGCGNHIKLLSEFAGKLVMCRKCGTKLSIDCTLYPSIAKLGDKTHSRDAVESILVDTREPFANRADLATHKDATVHPQTSELKQLPSWQDAASFVLKAFQVTGMWLLICLRIPPLGCLTLVVLGLIISMFQALTGIQQKTNETSEVELQNDTGTISVHCFGGRTTDALSKGLELVQRRDSKALDIMLLRQELVELENGTKVVIEDREWRGMLKVREAGTVESIWVYKEWVY